MKAYISDIKRFAVHDGDGIRTTLFFKGYPLKCVWCHNPEGISFKPELAYYEGKCIGCGECVTACASGAHTATRDGKHIFNRDDCTYCGGCEEVCLGGALKLYGKEYTVEELIEEVIEDKDFYLSSGGGVTLSGGECLSHSDFCKNLLIALKKNGINTAVDTCGYVPRESFDKVIPYTDTFLYDIKAITPEVHKVCTGRDNRVILDNLTYLDSVGCRIEVRIPFVPRLNSSEIEKMGELLSRLKSLVGCRILPYHSFAGSKYLSLGLDNTLPSVLPTEKELEKAKRILKAYGIKVL